MERQQSRDPVDIQQEREFKRQKAVEQAVHAADRIILDASDGSNEETDYLTAEVAKQFVGKVHGRLGSILLARDLNLRMKEKNKP